MIRRIVFGPIVTIAVLWSCYSLLITRNRSWKRHGAPSNDISYGCSSSPKHVALTFDDGPSFETAQVLQTLAEANVTATFFVSGGIRSHTAGAEKTTWLGDVHAAGHQIESHTWKHVNLSDSAPKDIEDDILVNEQWIQSVTGRRPRYLRPPYGECDDICLKTLRKSGYRTVRWNLDPQWSVERQEWIDLSTSVQESVDTLWEYPMEELWAHLGPIVVLHDFIDGTAGILLPQVLSFFRRKGYRFVTIEECLGKRTW